MLLKSTQLPPHQMWRYWWLFLALTVLPDIDIPMTRIDVLIEHKYIVVYD